MPMPAVLATIAQEGQGVTSPPTGVSTATGASGNYNNSFMTAASSGNSLTAVGNDLTFTIANEIYGNEHGAAGSATFVVKAYLRATGGTSFSQSAALASQSFNPTNGCSASFSASNSTQQDNTGGSGLGTMTISHGGGRGGITTPSLNDNIVVKVNGSATNSAGTTNASQVNMTMTWGN